ncbi:Cinnamyl alcohol dehydrogenase 7 [Triticum urartu]|uniref:Cinnamyl alcohol dehydrogenase 7 n=1 Tax=Triticum urartu TaxID=4572 RepID=M7ZHP0_TRIUA|nr:Cinnamyl alcohol dehydrogenase 7 [Triticum urartu]
MAPTATTAAAGEAPPIRIPRRSTGDDDVAIKVLYCGICHSDLHTIKNDWRNAIYPVVPGHEIAGVVTEMRPAAGTMHGIVNTASAAASLHPYLALLKPHGKMILLGIPDKPLQVSAFALIGGGKTLAGSCMASISETQEMLDFAAEHGVAADVEVIGAGEVNAAMERLAKGDVRYRFVIDVGNTLKAD